MTDFIVVVVVLGLLCCGLAAAGAVLAARGSRGGVKRAAHGFDREPAPYAASGAAAPGPYAPAATSSDRSPAPYAAVPDRQGWAENLHRQRSPPESPKAPGFPSPASRASSSGTFPLMSPDVVRAQPPYVEPGAVAGDDMELDDDDVFEDDV